MTDPSISVSVVDTQQVDFYGDEIPAVVVEGGRVFVPLRPICDFLGVDWSAQTRRVRRDTVLSESTSTVAITATDGREREMLCLQLDYLNGWLFGINANRVKSEAVKDKLVLYQRECYRVLSEHFQEPVALDSLAQVEQLGHALITLAREQREFDNRLNTTETDLVDVKQRVVAIEATLGAGDHAVTGDQASQLSQAVKAVAVVLTKQSGSNQFGGVYGELYRKFAITSYKLLPAARFQEAMDFLTDWHQTLVGDEPF